MKGETMFTPMFISNVSFPYHYYSIFCQSTLKILLDDEDLLIKTVSLPEVYLQFSEYDIPLNLLFAN